MSVIFLVFRGPGFTMSCPSSSILCTGGRFIITRSHDSWIRIGRSTNWPTQMYWTSFGGVGMNPGSTTKEAVVEVCLDDSAQK